MSVQADFHTTTYGNDHRDLGSNPDRFLPSGGGSGATGGRGGGLPFPFSLFTGNPSPTYPVGSTTPINAVTEPTSPKPPAGGGPPPEVAGVFAGLSARDWMSLAAAVTSLVGGATAGQSNSLAPNTMTNDPQLKELLAMMQGRLKKSEPLNDSILAMANGLLPTQYQNGGRG